MHLCFNFALYNAIELKKSSMFLVNFTKKIIEYRRKNIIREKMIIEKIIQKKKDGASSFGNHLRWGSC